MKRWLIGFGALALVVASGTDARAQMGIARGRVVDQDGKPVAGATVEFVFSGSEDRRFTTETDGDGRYTQMVPSGRYRVSASREGYQGTYQDVRIPTGTSAPTDLPAFQIVDREAAAQAAAAPILAEFERAQALSQAGELDEAAAAYEKLREDHPEIPEVHFNLGAVYGRQERWSEAEAAFQKVLELEPDNAQARALLAETLKNQGRAEEGVASLEALVASDPDDPDLHYNLGVFYLNAQRHEEAFASFDRVRELDPERVDVLYLLGTLSLNLGELDRAVGFFESYLEASPEDGQYRAPPRTSSSSSGRPRRTEAGGPGTRKRKGPAPEAGAGPVLRDGLEGHARD
jgi:tetratricopeptide (TPR) repeat protein